LQFRLLKSQDGAKWNERERKKRPYEKEQDARILKEEILVLSTHAVLLVPPGADRDFSRLESKLFLKTSSRNSSKKLS